jgi:GT2 family glycosyltransferase
MQTASGALVVLFNPSEVHVHNLLHLKRLCDEIVAVDNSPEFDSSAHGRIRAAGVEVLSNRNAGGVAGAYNRGIERLIEKGCRIFFIFDQDSEVQEDYFVQMRNACAALDTPHFLIGPKIFDVNVNRYLPAHVLRRFSLKAIPITDEKRGLLPCSSIITSGSMMSLETYRILGPFMEDYFIDHVDTEYSFRAMCKRVPVYINTSLVLKHQVGKRLDRKVLFFKLIQWNTGPIRQYYSARNCIHVSRRYGAQFPLLSLVNIITVQQIVSIALYEKDKRRKIVAMAAGIVDGIRGRYGSFETCRPRTSIFCAKKSY